ncbi:tyrosine decarboxylase MfnA [Methanobrevibacter curvatus]|uniref:Probable L-tyrosine/L-aspartate decarboxylase n=1 Tax=Methanobrevibacter curvatus TaxID=49547 RepID=A0A162FK13_9EURY|nr:tyrosine decarboxylase MfnA [Methanobrevibacter curvatus]KZX11160.1 glutamate decarboxylase [Methanobrevibacter curvatus]
MNDKPLDEESILKVLNGYKSKDLKYEDGHILGSMCTSTHPLAKKVYMDFLDSNLGDPGLFEGTSTIENMVVQEIASFLSLDKGFGNIVTGGTEANLMAIRSAKNIAKKEKGIEKGEIIVPKSAHFSFKKAADMLEVKLVEADLNKEYRVDIESVKKNINKNTIAIVGIAGTTELGVIDPIEELSQIAVENNIYFHVDAAFGGFSIPFLKEIGYELPNFDFSNEGVSSITIDPHKMGIAPIPAGCIIYREKKFLDIIAIDSPYLTSKSQSTIVGTRLGAPVAATWAVMQEMGKEGYMELANNCLVNANFLYDALKKENFKPIIKPELNIVAFYHEKIDTNRLAELLKEDGWMVSISNYPKAIRIVLMPHIRHTHLVAFLRDLRKIKASLGF